MAQEKPATVNSPSSASSTTYITHVTVIDTEHGKKIQDRTVIISGNRISEVRDSNGVKPPAGTKVVDGNGKYLIPGLWDMHVHAVFAERMDSKFPLFVANGVLGIRDMGTSVPLADINQLRRQTASGSRFPFRVPVTSPPTPRATAGSPFYRAPLNNLTAYYTKLVQRKSRRPSHILELAS